MNYRGYSIVQTCYGQWKVRISFNEEWLAQNEQDAKKQIDEYIIKKNRRLNHE